MSATYTCHKAWFPYGSNRRPPSARPIPGRLDEELEDPDHPENGTYRVMKGRGYQDHPDAHGTYEIGSQGFTIKKCIWDEEVDCED